MDRFDVEQQIMDCWHVVDDLKVLTEAVIENNLSHDEISNVLIGLETLYQLKFDKLFRTFEETIRQNHEARQESLFDDDNMSISQPDVVMAKTRWDANLTTNSTTTDWTI